MSSKRGLYEIEPRSRNYRPLAQFQARGHSAGLPSVQWAGVGLSAGHTGTEVSRPAISPGGRPRGQTSWPAGQQRQYGGHSGMKVPVSLPPSQERKRRVLAHKSQRHRQYALPGSLLTSDIIAVLGRKSCHRALLPVIAMVAC